MGVVLKTGFAPITYSTNFWPEPIKNGKNLALSGHVQNVQEISVFGNAKRISASCI